MACGELSTNEIGQKSSKRKSAFYFHPDFRKQTLISKTYVLILEGITRAARTGLKKAARAALAKRKLLLSSVSAAALATTLFHLQSKMPEAAAAGLVFAEKSEIGLTVASSNVRWGLALDKLRVFEDQLQRGDILGKILQTHGLTAQNVDRLVKNAAGVFSIQSMQVGKSFNILSYQNGSPAWLVYEPSPYEFVRMQLEEPFLVEKIQREVETKIESASGVLESSFWQAMTDNGLTDEVADNMIDILASQVDFYRQQKGDRFKVVFEQRFVEGKKAGTGRVLAALYERDGKISHAFRFEKADGKVDFFDAEGRPARKAFLKSPLKFSRISSGFSMARFHPVLKYSRPHFGTDYAAPHGTPILAVADGTVLEATRRGGNGNFVKIRHDKTYETQYLHMQGFAKGIRPGASVAQGQTIGYVGSTGLATGPHVCFRFWKNGQQVNHLKLDLPNPQPMTGEPLQKFMAERDVLIQKLEAVGYRTQSEIFQANAATTKVKP